MPFHKSLLLWQLKIEERIIIPMTMMRSCWSPITSPLVACLLCFTKSVLIMANREPFSSSNKAMSLLKLWKACAGPLVHVPKLKESVYYFPQGHMEQTERETDEVYAEIALMADPDVGKVRMVLRTLIPCSHSYQLLP